MHRRYCNLNRYSKPRLCICSWNVLTSASAQFLDFKQAIHLACHQAMLKLKLFILYPNTSTGNGTSRYDVRISSGFGGDILKAVNSLEDGDPMITNTLTGSQETLIEWDHGEDVEVNTFRLYDYFYGDPGSSPAMGRLELMYKHEGATSWNAVNFTEQRYVNGKVRPVLWTIKFSSLH